MGDLAQRIIEFTWFERLEDHAICSLLEIEVIVVALYVSAITIVNVNVKERIWISFIITAVVLIDLFLIEVHEAMRSLKFILLFLGLDLALGLLQSILLS